MTYLNKAPIAQGEIEFWAVTEDHFNGQETSDMEPENGHFIVAHSESGHHHVLERNAAEVKTVKNSVGMDILQVIVKAPTEVKNLNPNGHANLPIEPGFYEARISREMGLDDMIRRSQD
jgi:hypothetical protein